MLDFSEGAIISVHCSGSTDDETNFSIKYSGTTGFGYFISGEQLAASVSPAPQYEYPDEDDITSKQDSSLFTNMQFMLLGAILGVIATLIYWQIAKFC